jgi:hypothetical protein
MIEIYDAVNQPVGAIGSAAICRRRISNKCAVGEKASVAVRRGNTSNLPEFFMQNVKY